MNNQELFDQLDNFESVKYRIESEGIEYAFIHYSSFKAIKDDEFHRLRLKLIESINDIKNYIDNKIDELGDELFSKTNVK
jgi:hypothetical protein